MISSKPGSPAPPRPRSPLHFELEAAGGPKGGPIRSEIHGSYKAIVDSPVWRLVQALATLTSPDSNTILVRGYYDAVRPPTAYLFATPMPAWMSPLATEVCAAGYPESWRTARSNQIERMVWTEAHRQLLSGFGHGSGAHGPNEYMVIRPKAGSRIFGLPDIEKGYVDLLYALAET